VGGSESSRCESSSRVWPFRAKPTHPRRVRHGAASHFVTLAVMTKPDLVVRTEARINNHPLCHPLMTIRLVLFDALHTLVKPRAPIFLQYANVFEPHLGKLSPEAIKSSFKTGKLQISRHCYMVVRVYDRTRVKHWGRCKSNALPMPAVPLSGGVRS